MTKNDWVYTLPTDQQFRLELQFKSVFNLEFHSEFSIQLEIPILMGINLGECSVDLSWFIADILMSHISFLISNLLSEKASFYVNRTNA